MTSFTIDYLMWHHFGKQTDECNNANMIRQYRTYFQRLSNPANLASFIETYIKYVYCLFIEFFFCLHQII